VADELYGRLIAGLTQAASEWRAV